MQVAAQLLFHSNVGSELASRGPSMLVDYETTFYN